MVDGVSLSLALILCISEIRSSNFFTTKHLSCLFIYLCTTCAGLIEGLIWVKKSSVGWKKEFGALIIFSPYFIRLMRVEIQINR